MAATQGITFIGIGNMGLAAVLALRKANLPITIWNRTTTSPKVQSAIAAGATLEPSLSAALSANPLIIICLLDYPTITSLFSPLSPSLFTNKTIINLTNGTPRQSTAMQTLLTDRQVTSYFDGAIMVTPQMVGSPHSLLVISGQDESTFSSISHALSPIGNPQYLGPDITSASRFDLAALSAMYGMFAGGMAGMALLKRGPGSPKIGKTVKEQIVPIISALVEYLGLLAEAWDGERWGDSMGNPMGMQLEGVKNIVEACREEGVDGRVLEALRGQMEGVVGRFGADSGLAGLGILLLGEEGV
ncbi:hypothetical protein QBC34DRAFT_160202 [Podospora aff. communis PSN243]|uniref:6-phosphogluconate dehydrogenase NADP-binding domain-containing protein n=1 Tax=Podospora aff. communis PSN243 TaxID=3040156 RepID=A0AAV9H4Q1_9PEZI|nr:hypothetical protein QBC34DRAFT_160202 [Podospora aff. communis PSN243]